MQNSELFIGGKYKELGEKVKDHINSQSDFLSERTISSTRAVGDAIQNLLEEHFPLILGESIKDYSSDFARRAMADLAFNDGKDNYYVIDVKTHRLDTT